MQAPAIEPTSLVPIKFYGHTIVRAAFVLAVFGWGVGFYGPPIFLHAVVARTGWALSLVSSAVTLHFLAGAVVVACLPRIHRRIGLPITTAAGAVALAIGTVGWALAAHPWQLFAAASLTGGAWVLLSAAAINAIVSPWFVRTRPMALSKAYNGASIGGVVMSPLWVALIERFGFAAASLIIGSVLVATVVPLALRVFAKTPLGTEQLADGADAPLQSMSQSVLATGIDAPIPIGAHLWTNRSFLTLTAAMALGLFAQIGLIAHLYSLLVPIMGAQMSGWVMALATGCGMTGRTVVARLLAPHVDRRIVASASYAMQALGTLMLLIAGTGHLPLIVLGIALFGLGIGNATSLAPLIAQMEFSKDDVPRVVAQSVAVSQGLYAFAPALFALLLIAGAPAAPTLGVDTAAYFSAVLMIQVAAIAFMLAGRR